MSVTTTNTNPAGSTTPRPKREASTLKTPKNAASAIANITHMIAKPLDIKQWEERVDAHAKNLGRLGDSWNKNDEIKALYRKRPALAKAVFKKIQNQKKFNIKDLLQDAAGIDAGIDVSSTEKIVKLLQVNEDKRSEDEYKSAKQEEQIAEDKEMVKKLYDTWYNQACNSQNSRRVLRDWTNREDRAAQSGPPAATEPQAQQASSEPKAPLQLVMNSDGKFKINGWTSGNDEASVHNTDGKQFKILRDDDKSYLMTNRELEENNGVVEKKGDVDVESKPVPQGGYAILKKGYEINDKGELGKVVGILKTARPQEIESMQVPDQGYTLVSKRLPNSHENLLTFSHRFIKKWGQYGKTWERRLKDDLYKDNDKTISATAQEGNMMVEKAYMIVPLMDGNLKGLKPESEAEATLQLSDRKVIKIMLDVANGVKALHDQNIVHNDLSLGNILYKKLEGGGINAFVADFGGATKDGAAVHTYNQEYYNKYDDMARDGKQLKAAKKHDLMALGFIFYDMLKSNTGLRKRVKRIYNGLIKENPDLKLDGVIKALQEL